MVVPEDRGRSSGPPSIVGLDGKIYIFVVFTEHDWIMRVEGYYYKNENFNPFLVPQLLKVYAFPTGFRKNFKWCYGQSQSATSQVGLLLYEAAHPHPPQNGASSMKPVIQIILCVKNDFDGRQRWRAQPWGCALWYGLYHDYKWEALVLKLSPCEHQGFQ